MNEESVDVVADMHGFRGTDPKTLTLDIQAGTTRSSASYWVAERGSRLLQVLRTLNCFFVPGTPVFASVSALKYRQASGQN
jgi:hypothetical protein